MKNIIYIFILCFTCTVFSQTKITGKVWSTKEKPLVGVNLYLEGTYDGTITDENGEFSFETTEKGAQTLVATLLNYETVKVPITIENNTPIIVKMRAMVNVLEAVELTAGSFKAGDNSKASALKPLDIVTTAGSAGDIVGALQTLPGAQVVGESGRLFVRGGESEETQTYIDGIRVAQPYGVTANNLPTRGRFSPFLFNGMTFSTGGYSAEYGDALSSVLLLNSITEPDQDKTDISVMTVGLGYSRTKKWNKSSLSLNTSYINLQPYQWLVPQKVDWNRPYQGFSGESIFRKKFDKGLWKVYLAYDNAAFDLNQKDINSVQPIRIHNKNTNVYFNSSYKGNLGNGWTLQTGGSFSYNTIATLLDIDRLHNKEIATHFKTKLDKKISNSFRVAFGGDYFRTKLEEVYTPFLSTALSSGYENNVGAFFVESDVFFSSTFAMKVGGRAMYGDLLHKSVIEPRVSLAFKATKNGQFSFAYGDFHQTPKQDYLKYTSDLNYEKTAHYILNYMYQSNKRTLRTEIFYKDYDNLVKFNTNTPQFNSTYNNNGYGYAKGLDVFWRDGHSVKNLEYWISYSFIDSKRDFRNYTSLVQPSFVADHTLSIVGKYWVNDWKSQISITNTFASGRPYNNPNVSQFMNGKTKEFNNLSLAWSYLITQQKILFFSVSNILGRDNVFGYQYANTPDTNGQFQRQAITQPADRFFFVGFFWTISSDKKANQLENL